jgi:hypothetical protein
MVCPVAGLATGPGDVAQKGGGYFLVPGQDLQDRPDQIREKAKIFISAFYAKVLVFSRFFTMPFLCFSVTFMVLQTIRS